MAKILSKAKWIYEVKSRKVIFLFQDIFKINILFSLSNDRKVILQSEAFGINWINFLMKMSAQVSCTKVLAL